MHLIVWLVLTLSFGQRFDDSYQTEYVTATETSDYYVTETPIEWITTPIVTTTMLTTPSPTCAHPIVCDLSNCKCKKGYRCEYVGKVTNPCAPCPPTRCVPECVKCPSEIPECKCREDQICAYQKGSCFQCPFFYCLDIPLNCVQCQACVPECDCENPSMCIYHEQTCDSCPFYTCYWDPKCPQVAEECDPACKNDEICMVKRDELDGCPKRICLPLECSQRQTASLVDPCQFCKAEEECKIAQSGNKECVPRNESPCLKCPEIDTNLKCPENSHLIVEPNDCHKCGNARCEPNQCINCFAPPVPKQCANDEVSVLIEPSCYDCGSFECVKKTKLPLLNTECDGDITVKIVDGEPTISCKESPCKLCDPLASCDSIKCPSGYECQMTPRTCKVCPKISCEPIIPNGCDPNEASCSKILCPENMICEETPGDTENCPKAQCISVDECIICPQVMPSCDCENPEECILIKQSCRHCAHYACKSKLKCLGFKTCDNMGCPAGYHCEGMEATDLVCPITECVPDTCEKCQEAISSCPNSCDRNEVCQSVVSTCGQCSKAVCQKNPECKECVEQDLKCHCGPEEDCVFDSGDCENCPAMKCIPKPCVECPERDIEKEDCSKCKKDEYCEITPRSCSQCAFGSCKSKCVQCDPRLTECHCSAGEICHQIPGDCLTCPRAECKPKPECIVCDPLAARCSCGENEIGIFVPGDCHHCPSCRCEELPKEVTCKSPARLVSLPVGSTLAKACIQPEDIVNCPTSMPQCACQNPLHL